MNKRIFLIIVSVLVGLVLGLTSCITVNPQPASSVLPAPTLTPEYHTLSFILEGKGQYSFPIYLHNNETLHFMMRTKSESGSIYLHILTPSGKRVGSYGRQPNNPGQYASGTLADYTTQGFQTFMTQFKPSDYDWGEGYYRMEFVNEYTQVETVVVEYWVESEA